MSVQVALASVKGAPGVSVAALVLGWSWPGDGPVLVAEVDPAGADLHHRLGLGADPGLAALAAARGAVSAAGLGAHVHTLSARLALLGGCVNPTEARAAVSALGAGPLEAARAGGFVGLWDCGRLDPVTAPVLRGADVVVLVCRPEPAELAHVVPCAAELADGGANVAVLVVGGRRRRGAGPVGEAGAAVAARLGPAVTVIGHLPADRLGVHTLERGPARLVSHTPLAAAAAGAAARLCELAAAPAPAGEERVR